MSDETDFDETGKKGTSRSWLRILFDVFVIISIVGIVGYIIGDNVSRNSDSSNDLPVGESPIVESPIKDVVRTCSNPEIIESQGPFEETELDEYVWRKDGSYRFKVTINEYLRGDNMQKIVAKFWSQTWLADEDWKLQNTGRVSDYRCHITINYYWRQYIIYRRKRVVALDDHICSESKSKKFQKRT